MIQIVINHDPSNGSYKVYEPTTDTVLVSDNLTEALVNLGQFLMASGFITCSLLEYPEITYHIDSETMKSMVESNVNLVKRLQSGPSEFTKSSQRFGGSNVMTGKSKNDSRDFTSSHKSFAGKRSSTFSGKSGFKTANKKFGGNKM